MTTGQPISGRLIDVARSSAIVTAVGLLYSPTVASIGLIAAYVAFVLSGEALDRLKRAISHPPVYWGLAFLGVVVVGFAYGPATWPERWVDLLKWRTVLWFIVMFALFDDERWKMRLLHAFLIGAVVGLVASFAGVVGEIKLWKPPSELLRNHATQSMVFSLSAVICLWMVLAGRCKGRARWWAILAAGLFAGNLFLVTQGRSGYVVFVLGIIVLLIQHASPKQWIAVAAVLPVLMGVVLLLSPGMQKRTLSQGGKERTLSQGIEEWEHAEESAELTSMGIRKVFYTHTIAIVANHLMVGVGSGGFKKAYAEQIAGKYSPSDWRSEIANDPHNQYLAIAVQHGLLGLTVFIAWIVAIMRTQAGLPVYRGLALAILCGWCATSLFSSHFRTFAEGHLLMTFLGVLLALAPPMQREPGSSAVSPSNFEGTQ